MVNNPKDGVSDADLRVSLFELGRIFEKLVLGPNASIECPSCPGASVEKQFSAFSFNGVGGARSEVRGAG